jgi:hypothetical protein
MVEIRLTIRVRLISWSKGSRALVLRDAWLDVTKSIKQEHGIRSGILICAFTKVSTLWWNGRDDETETAHEQPLLGHQQGHHRTSSNVINKKLKLTHFGILLFALNYMLSIRWKFCCYKIVATHFFFREHEFRNAPLMNFNGRQAGDCQIRWYSVARDHVLFLDVWFQSGRCETLQYVAIVQHVFSSMVK